MEVNAVPEHLDDVTAVAEPFAHHLGQLERHARGEQPKRDADDDPSDQGLAAFYIDS
jgi:hypothetical protein